MNTAKPKRIANKGTQTPIAAFPPVERSLLEETAVCDEAVWEVEEVEGVEEGVAVAGSVRGWSWTRTMQGASAYMLSVEETAVNSWMLVLCEVQNEFASAVIIPPNEGCDMQ